ncbi:MAG: gamma subclass chorismate mutase AroQ [Pseudomonadales bacterium]|nr:gamma subclass chorismate mutase AroQ [Pseudomonadales bacterium]
MKINYYQAWLLSALGFLFLSLASVVHAQETEIFQLINERLAYMEDVALYKSQNQLPVEDLAREQVVVENAVAAAESIGLAGSSIESFFSTQIEVAKAIQYRSLADWISEPVNHSAPDLVTEIRPALTTLGDQIVATLANFLSDGNIIEENRRSLFHQIIDSEQVSAADKDQLFDSLLLVRMQ